jgi:hypothetical protein
MRRAMWQIQTLTETLYGTRDPSIRQRFFAITQRWKNELAVLAMDPQRVRFCSVQDSQRLC